MNDQIPATDAQPSSLAQQAMETSIGIVKVWLLKMRYQLPAKFVDDVEEKLTLQLTGLVDRERDLAYTKGYNAGFKNARRYFTSGNTSD